MRSSFRVFVFAFLMHIGIFGGTFDPVHLGHLLTAEQCREQAKLDQVWFVPASRPPHKLGHVFTSFARRVEMLELAIAGNTTFRIDTLENELPGPSFTINTLEELRRRHPGDEFFLLVGSDVLPDLPTWHEPKRLLSQVRLVLVPRPGFPVPSDEKLRTELNLSAELAPIVVREMPLIDLASRDLRRRAVAGHSLRYQVPRAVECYIDTHRLYRPAPAE